MLTKLIVFNLKVHHPVNVLLNITGEFARRELYNRYIYNMLYRTPNKMEIYHLHRRSQLLLNTGSNKIKKIKSKLFKCYLNS